MNDETVYFAKIVAELCRVRAQMKDVAHSLREAFPQAKIEHNINFAQYENPHFPERGIRYVIEVYVDIDFEDEKSLCWWIDVEQFGQVWNVKASLLQDEAQDTLWKAHYRAETVDELWSHISTVFDEMKRFAAQKGENFI